MTNTSARITKLEILRVAARHYAFAGLFSLGVNVLYLTSPLYMMQVYDRVLASASVMTLIMLTIVMLVAFLAMAGLDYVRALILVRSGVRLDKSWAERLLVAQVESAAAVPAARRGQLLRDLDKLRDFASGSGMQTLFDAPWLPIYLGAVFLIHPALAALACGGALFLTVFAVANELITSGPLRKASTSAAASYAMTDAALRNSEAIRAMGMLEGLATRWRSERLSGLGHQVRASDRGAAISAATRFIRLSLQSLMLGLGAYLVLDHALTPGGMLAGSVLMGRALAPVEMLVSTWRQFVSAQASLEQVTEALSTAEAPQAMKLPKPAGALRVEKIVFMPPGSDKATIKGIDFSISPGESVGIIGPSGAGKSSLVRMLVGVWKPTQGAVRLDGADVFNWPSGDRGTHIGYLPQDIELFAGSVRDNIARFGSGQPEDIIAAAQAAGVHDMILRLPQGYETDIGQGGCILSGGQRQRIALARAAYGMPPLVVLDEPNSNLDSEGERALQALLQTFKARGTTVVVVAHNSAVLAHVDRLAVLVDGHLETYGPRAEVLARLRPATPMQPKAAS